MRKVIKIINALIPLATLIFVVSTYFIDKHDDEILEATIMKQKNEIMVTPEFEFYGRYFSFYTWNYKEVDAIIKTIRFYDQNGTKASNLIKLLSIKLPYQLISKNIDICAPKSLVIGNGLCREYITVQEEETAELLEKLQEALSEISVDIEYSSADGKQEKSLTYHFKRGLGKL